jgi:hypothetical protein
MQGMTSLDAFNAVLALLRLLAVYGRKAFAALDTLRTLLQGNEGASDGTVSVANCFTPPNTTHLQAALYELAAASGFLSDRIDKCKEEIVEGVMDFCGIRGIGGNGQLLARLIKVVQPKEV